MRTRSGRTSTSAVPLGLWKNINKHEAKTRNRRMSLALVRSGLHKTSSDANAMIIINLDWCEDFLVINPNVTSPTQPSPTWPDVRTALTWNTMLSTVVVLEIRCDYWIEFWGISAVLTDCLLHVLLFHRAANLVWNVVKTLGNSPAVAHLQLVTRS